MSKDREPQNPYKGLSLAQVLTTMLQLLADEERNPFLMGQLYNYLAESNLLEGTRYKTPVAFFRNNIQKLPRTALPRYGAVAREFGQAAVTRFGLIRLELLLAYKKGAQITLNSEEPGSTFIVVPQDNSDLRPKHFADCSMRDLRKALEHLRAPSSYLPVSPADRACYERYREAILQHFPKGVRVVMRNHEGTTLMDFENIPASQANKFMQVLRELRREVSAGPEEDKETPQPH
jgi:hypothetical protein